MIRFLFAVASSAVSVAALVLHTYVGVPIILFDVTLLPRFARSEWS